MDADTPAKRYSAMSLGCPWRGLNTLPDLTVTKGRAAVMYLYVGIPTASVTTPNTGLLVLIGAGA